MSIKEYASQPIAIDITTKTTGYLNRKLIGLERSHKRILNLLTSGTQASPKQYRHWCILADFGLERNNQIRLAIKQRERQVAN